MNLGKLLREWAALLAVLAVALGPLALGVTRSLAASEKAAIAAGLKPLALCIPGMPDGGGTGPDCDHCAGAQSLALAEGAVAGVTAPSATRPGSIRSAPFAAAFPRGPPARGPPSA
jgi:hypothetical protein